MEEWFRSGRAVDFVLAFVVLEAAAVFLLHRRSGRGLTPAALLSLLIPGICLLLALRIALTGGHWVWLAAWLLAALLAHLADLAQRWRR